MHEDGESDGRSWKRLNNAARYMKRSGKSDVGDAGMEARRLEG